jgi:hypothetical protein
MHHLQRQHPVSRRRPPSPRRRGMALLLVMIGLVVCTILTTGFLLTQGTAIGIARNERDAIKARDIAHTGIDLCYWLVRNRADWREAMTPGTKWLNNYPVGDGTVTVTVDMELAIVDAPVGGTYLAGASPGAAPYVALGSPVGPTTVVCKIGGSTVPAGAWGTIAKLCALNGQSVGLGQTLFLVKPYAVGSFADDPARGVTLTAVGAYDNRSYTLLATIRPTGGGTVFQNGSFINGTIIVGDGKAAVVDSYNSGVAAYSQSSAGSNAAFASDSLANGALTINASAVFLGSYTAAPTALTPVKVNGGVTQPATSTALETRDLGAVVFPNIAGLRQGGPLPPPDSSNTVTLAAPAIYGDVTINGTTLNITNGAAATATYSFNNFTLGNNSGSTLTIPDGKTVNLIVRGNLNINTGRITLNGTGQLNIYLLGNGTINAASVNEGGNTAHLMLFGGTKNGNLNITNDGAVMCGLIYAPQHTVTLANHSPKLYGAIIAQSLTLKDTSEFHFDEALRTVKISNITGGSAAPATADYCITIIGGTGILKGLECRYQSFFSVAPG